MRYEVEQKFPVEDLAAVRAAIANRGATSGDTVTQVDTYYAHPMRDFATTDEAMRLRCVNDTNVFTYKGPKLDATTKTREEIELPIQSGQHGATLGSQLLEALSFKPVATVSKVRQTYHLEYENQTIEFALDTIEGLGQFVEIEIVAEGEQAMDSARKTIGELATELSLTEPERRSYLELILEA